MKKVLTSIFACAIAIIAMSCNNSENANAESSKDYIKMPQVTKGNDNKMDTLSYIIGQNIGNNIVNGMMPQLKADYDAIVSALEKTALVM